MATKREVRSRRQKEWIPSGEQIGASLVDAAVRALETHGGRPEIRDVPEHVETIEMPHSMFERLQRDYENMAGMIIGPIPAFVDIIASVVDLERRLNRPGA